MRLSCKSCFRVLNLVVLCVIVVKDSEEPFSVSVIESQVVSTDIFQHVIEICIETVCSVCSKTAVFCLFFREKQLRKEGLR